MALLLGVPCASAASAQGCFLGPGHLRETPQRIWAVGLRPAWECESGSPCPRVGVEG